jgi:hypothetical protein
MEMAGIVTNTGAELIKQVGNYPFQLKRNINSSSRGWWEVMIRINASSGFYAMLEFPNKIAIFLDA